MEGFIMSKEEVKKDSGYENKVVDIISASLKVPGVKVVRTSFLADVFKDKDTELIKKIIDVGPVEAGIPRKELTKIANNVINTSTTQSALVSFAAGIPGGLAMAATIPADTLQYFGVAIRIAQQLSYLYGAEDLWSGNEVDEEKVKGKLIIYLGAMFGSGTAVSTVRIVSNLLSKQALKKLPTLALTKTFYYPIIKSIAKFIGVRMTKSIFAKGVSKAIPIIGGIVSGGLTYFTLKPMSEKLQTTLDEAKFNYTEEVFEADWKEITKENLDEEIKTEDSETQEPSVKEEPTQPITASNTMDEIAKAKQLLDSGIIDEEEFKEIKAKLIKNM